MTPDTDLTSGIARDAFWLDGLLDVVRRDRPGDAVAACTAYVGLWICRSAAPATEVVFRGATRRILDLVPGFDSPPPATLGVLTQAILAKSGVSAPSLDALVQDAAEAMREASGGDPAQDVERCEERVLLHLVGQEPMPGRVTADQALATAERLRGDAPPSDVDTLLLWTGSATSYGTVPPRQDDRSRDLAALLARLAVGHLHANHLRTASRLLRHACYLGLEAAERRRLAGLVARQQRPIGGYGFFADAGERLRELGGSDLRADVDLHLPVTMECLWGLTEATSDWRLFRSVSRPADQP